MIGTKYILSVLLALVSVLSAGLSGVNAQDIDFIATAPEVVIKGKAFNYTITGNENIRGQFQLPDVDGIRVAGGPSTFMSTQSSFISGKMENITTVTYTYNFIALKEGNITIPPAVIKSGNRTISTNPVEINVVSDPAAQASPDPNQPKPSSEPAEDYYIRMIPSKRSVFLGEEILVSVKIFTNQRLSFSEVKYPELEGFWKQETDADQQASREIINGREYLTQVFKRDLLIPQKTGEIQIKPVDATVLIQQRIRSQRRSPFGDIFNDPFFDSYENVPVVLTSNPLKIEVKPLPEGAPEGFTGAVGQFALDVTGGREQIKVNEALTLKVNLKGTGNLSLLKIPVLSTPPDIEVFEPKITRSVKHTLNGSGGSVTAEYVIIPRYPGKFRIPPLEFSYFDPVKKSYEKLTSREINILVDADKSTDQASVSGGHNVLPGMMREKVTSLNTDILFIKTNKPDFIKTGSDFTGRLLFRLFIPSGIILYILLVILYRKRIRQNSDLAYARTKKARKKAEKRLRAARKWLDVNNKMIYEEILKVLWDYLSDKLNVPRAGLSRETVENGLAEYSIPADLMEKLWMLMDVCEMEGYASGSNAEPYSVYTDAEDILYKFEQIIK